MKKLSTIFILLSIQVFAMSPSSQAGEELYLEADCQKCHNKGASFDDKNKKAKNLSELKGWVSSCAGFYNIEWFPEEEKEVLNYLNEEFYKFKVPSK